MARRKRIEKKEKIDIKQDERDKIKNKNDFCLSSIEIKKKNIKLLL